jgi:hypothetical protein
MIIIIYEGHDMDRVYYMLRKIYLGKSIRYEVIMPYKELNRDRAVFLLIFFSNKHIYTPNHLIFHLLDSKDWRHVNDVTKARCRGLLY